MEHINVWGLTFILGFATFIGLLFLEMYDLDTQYERKEVNKWR